MVPPFFARARIDGKARRRKSILPRPLARRFRKFPREGERKMHTAKPIFQILFVLRFNSQQMTAQRFTQFSGSIVMRSLPPFASRTVICASAKSMSLMRKRTHSINRSPLP